VQSVAGRFTARANHPRPDPTLSPAHGRHRPLAQDDLDLDAGRLDYDEPAGPGDPRVQGAGPPRPSSRIRGSRELLLTLVAKIQNHSIKDQVSALCSKRWGCSSARPRSQQEQVMVNLAVIDDPNEFAKQLFKAGQQSAAWLRSAGHLRDAAEAILKHELPAEREYSEARKIADGEALAEAVRNDTAFGTADIKAIAPNYPPAQLLYTISGAALCVRDPIV
jgi:hypothetical protein